MENNIEIFENSEFGKIRTVCIGDESYFVGKDVAEILGYSEPRSAISKRIDKEDRGVAKMETPSGQQEMTVINESGLYSLILGSKLPSAKKFKRWVTSEVLPTIRKTGGYVSNDDMFINTYLPFADDNTKNLFKLQLNVITQLDHKIETDKPLVDFATAIQVSDDCIDMGIMSKIAAKTILKLEELVCLVF